MAQLLEMSSIGRNFIWTNNSIRPNFKLTKPDGALTNQHWIDCSPAATLQLLSDASDFKGMIATFSQVEKGKKPFRLVNSWLEDLEFIALVKSGLSKQIRGTELFKIQEKLKLVKNLLKEWAKAKGSFDKQLTFAKEELDKAMEVHGVAPSSINLQTATLEKRNKLRSLLEEKADLRQRSKISVAKTSNARFFSIATQTKIVRSKKPILKILNNEERQSLPRAQLEYFKNLL